MNSTATIADRRTRVRDMLATPVGVASLPEVRVLLRFLTFTLFLTTALSLYLWARMGVREAAVDLDTARSELARAQVAHDRLILEETMLRQPNRVGAAAGGLGLQAPVETHVVAARP